MEVTRRKLLQGMGFLAGFIALRNLASPEQALAAVEDFPGYPDRYGMLTDTTMCAGCRWCEVACAQANSMPPPAALSDKAVFNKMRRPSADALTVVNSYTDPADTKRTVFRKMQCMHCNEPACVSACLVGALEKTKTGNVVYHENKCIGCRYCMVACPFGALGYEYSDALSPAVRKCTMCYQKVVKEGGIPACAQICPTKATIFGKRSDLIEVARGRIRSQPGKYTNLVYGENEAGGTSWLYLSSVPFDQIGLPTNLGKTPIPELTRDWLLAVPLVLITWPPLLLGFRSLFRRREQIAEEEAKNRKVV